MSWADQVIWWQVYPLGFCGAPINWDDDSGDDHRLRRLLRWLDYPVEMGANGLLLGPVFRSGSHGYDTVDHQQIDPRLGDDDDFDDLLQQAHDKGLRVVLDGVFNHVAWEHPFVQDVREKGAESQYVSWFHTDLSDPDDVRFEVFEGHGDLVGFNHEEPAVVDYITEVMNGWLARGVDGWRLDAAYTTKPEFWQQVLPRVREAHPDAWIFGEVIHGDYADIVQSSGFDSVTQYELWKACWSSMDDENFYELEWTLKRHNEFLDAFTPQTFIGNHDVTRIASKVGQPNAILALCLLMTVGGIPSIYYGDEQGVTGVKEERLGGDDQVRPPMPDSPDELSDLGRWVFEAHQQLIGVRRRNPWLVTARTETQAISDEHFVYCARPQDPNEASITVELLLGDQPEAIVRQGDEELFRYPR